MRPRMDFHQALHVEYLWHICYKNALIYFNRDFSVQGEHPDLLQLFDDTCLIFCQFLTIVFIESQPVWTRIVEGLYIDCSDTTLAYANMQTFFLRNFKFKIVKKNVSENHENV